VYDAIGMQPEFTFEHGQYFVVSNGPWNPGVAQPNPAGTQLGTVIWSANAGDLGHFAILEARRKLKLVKTFDS